MNNGNEIALGMGKAVVKGWQEAQEMRIRTNNRVRDLIYRKVEGIPFEKPQEKKEEKKHEEKFKDSKIPQYLDTLLEKGEITKKERKYVDTLVDISTDLKTLEDTYAKLLKPYVEQEEIYKDYYKNIKGVGPAMAAQLIQMLGYCDGVRTEEDGRVVEKVPHASSLRRYCCMDPDGAKGRTKGQKLHGNIKAKTLWWKIGSQMMMAKNPTYIKLYNERKELETERMEKNDPSAPKNALQAHLRAMRWATQKFINWHWVIGRQLKGYPTNRGWIFEVKNHSDYIPPPIIPEILKDEKGQWDPIRPAGWIFENGKKDWSEADDYIKRLCGRANES